MCESVRAVELTPISFLHWKPIKVWHIWWSHLLSKTGTNLTAGGEIQQLLTSKDAVMYEIDTFHWFCRKTLKRKNELCYNFNGDGFSNELMSLCNIWNGNFRLGFTKTFYLRGMIDFNNRWNDCVMEAHWTQRLGSAILASRVGQRIALTTYFVKNIEGGTRKLTSENRLWSGWLEV